jgi:hypothetical protein
MQTIGSILKDHLQVSGAATAAQLQPLVPAIMEVLAGLIEEGIPEALAPFTKVGLTCARAYQRPWRPS